MYKYEVIFTKGNKIHKIKVKATGIVPAIEEAVHKHIMNYKDGLGYEITGANKTA